MNFIPEKIINKNNHTNNLSIKIKNAVFASLILFLLFFFIRHPKESVLACTQGMKLWLNTLIPTLLPFMILTSILIQTNTIDFLFQPLKPLWKILFGLSPQGVYAFFTGILCGYPMGARITSDLYENQKISKREAHYLLTFSNNASPAFIINYLYLTCLNKRTSLREIFFTLLISTFLCMLFFRFIIYHNYTINFKKEIILKGNESSNQRTSSINNKPEISNLLSDTNNSKKETSTASSFGTLIDVSIMNGFETITRLGGYILLFSLISAVINHYHVFPYTLRLLLSGSAELTTGLHQLSQSNMPYLLKYTFSTALTAFGGFSIMAQTRSVVHKQLSITPYICAKLLNTIICILLITSRA